MEIVSLSKLMPALLSQKASLDELFIDYKTWEPEESNLMLFLDAPIPDLSGGLQACCVPLLAHLVHGKDMPPHELVLTLVPGSSFSFSSLPVSPSWRAVSPSDALNSFLTLSSVASIELLDLSST
jgi:hypothetical protein